MASWFVPLLLGSYLLGSVPASYIMARRFYGIDLRQYGTGQVGGGNLWRMTSWKLAVPVSLFDGFKGLIIVWIAQSAGGSPTQQILVGLAAIIGHAWPVFLRFSGGRGIGTTMGVILILPIINEVTPWPTVTFFAILVIGTIILRSSPVPVLLAAAAVPVLSIIFGEPLTVNLALLAMFLVIVIKRLTAPLSPDSATVSRGRLLLNRFLFDRDIMDKNKWMYRKPPETAKQE
ncbi:glycerol-3-phosphate acyltransferase [Chloroflexota bacterium]